MLEGQGSEAKAARQNSGKAIDDLIGRSALLAADPAVPEALRASAVKLLAVAGSLENQLSLFQSLLSARTPASLQIATIEALSEHSAPQTPELLLNVWSSSEPVVRSAIFDTLVSRSEWLPPLVSQLEAGTLADARGTRKGSLPAAPRRHHRIRPEAEIVTRP